VAGATTAAIKTVSHSRACAPSFPCRNVWHILPLCLPLYSQMHDVLKAGSSAYAAAHKSGIAEALVLAYANSPYFKETTLGKQEGGQEAGRWALSLGARPLPHALPLPPPLSLSHQLARATADTHTHTRTHTHRRVHFSHRNGHAMTCKPTSAHGARKRCS
jgi:hypothetical protein